MRRLLGLWLSLALTLVAASHAAASSSVRAEADPSRQILVMLRLGPEHLRPGADYSGGYGDGMARAARHGIASRIARAHGLTVADSWPMPLVGVDCFVLTVPPGASPEALAADLSHDPSVAWSQAMNLYRTEGGPATHNDPLYPAQPAAKLWRLADLHRYATGRGVRVAVIDSGVDVRHPDLAGQVTVSQNFVAGRPAAIERHGTNVAGVIAAKADNHVGIAGVAPDSRLLALRACWQEAAAATVCDSLSLAKALSFAINHGAGIINLSLAGRPDRLLGALIDVATSRRVSVVAAYDRALPEGGFPASHPGVTAVAEQELGPAPAAVLAAPGREVPTTQPGGQWGLVNGASFAAAHASGLLALMRQRPIRGSGDMFLVALRPGGIIDACASLARAVGPGPCAVRNTALVRR